jgi:hypothetical protein
MREYQASLGNLSKIITALVIIFMIGFIVMLSYKNTVEPRKEFAFATAFGLFMLMIPVIAFFYRPKAYVITDDALLIKRIAGNYRIPLSVIKSVIAASREDMRITIRTFGNGGLFGFTGHYRNSRFGRMRWFVSQRQNYLVIETSEGTKFVISPDEPEVMEDDLQKSLLN